MPVHVLSSDFAYELDVSENQARLLIREYLGNDDEGPLGWSFTEKEIAELRRIHPAPPRSSRQFDLTIGRNILRRSLLRALGGSWQNGIAPSGDLPEIFAFTNPKSGARYGYDRFEGLQEDGSFSYTANGQKGHQFFDSTNSALRDAAKTGRSIRLFTAAGPRVTYVGSFTNGTPTYRYEEIPDIEGRSRRGIIFNLVPVEADVRRLPSYGGVSRAIAVVSEWSPPESFDLIVEGPDSAPAGDRVVSRLEFELQAAFGRWLTTQGTPPSRLTLPAGSARIEPDLYVTSSGWIVEAKKSTARAYVRTAIWQVLDYANVANQNGYSAIPVILLPGHPEPDLQQLILSLNIITAVRRGEEFELIEA